jgi:hypothetical protein
MCRLLCWLRKRLCSPKGRVHWTLRFGSFSVSAEGFHMATTIPVDTTKAVVAEVKYIDSKGNPAKVDGVPTWTSSDETVFTVAADSVNPFKAVITPGGLGTAQLKAVADADMGDGVKELITLGDIEIVAGEAVAGTLTISLD